MGHRFGELIFSEAVKAEQERQGSRAAYRRQEDGPAHHDRLGPAEAAFLAARDSCYVATVGADGWPYVQHRGGPPGFIKVLDETSIGFADYRGNRQYVTVGNLAGEARVALILVDYAHRRRLKLLGRARCVGPDEEELLARLATPAPPQPVERGVLIAVEAFDWNCPQHITPRYTLDEIAQATAPLRTRLAELEARLGDSGSRADG